MYLKGKKCKSVEPNSFRIGIQDFPYDRKRYALLAREREEFQNSVINAAICEEWELLKIYLVWRLYQSTNGHH